MEIKMRGWVNLTGFCFVGMNRFQGFDMIVKALPLLNMWYNDVDGDHIRTLTKYVGILTELLNMKGWPELIKVLTGY